MPKSNNIYLITGDDIAEIAHQAQLAVTKLAGDNPDEYSLDTYSESDEKAAESILSEVLISLKTPSFFGKKTVWLKNFTKFDKEGTTKDDDSLTKTMRLLSAFVKNDFPEDVNLIVSGTGLDPRKTFFKTFKDKGNLVLCKKPDLGSYKWKEEVRGKISQRIREKDMPLKPIIVEYLVEVIGEDTARIESELEKLSCANSSLTDLTLEEVQELCPGNPATHFWAFGNALGQRNLKTAMNAIKHLLEKEKNPEGACIALCSNAAKDFKLLLHTKLFMHGMKIKNSSQVQSTLQNLSAQKKEEFADNALIKMHPYRAKLLAESAVKYSGSELIDAYDMVTDFSRRLVTTSTPGRMLLEQLAVKVISR